MNRRLFTKYVLGFSCINPTHSLSVSELESAAAYASHITPCKVSLDTNRQALFKVVGHKPPYYRFLKNQDGTNEENV